MGFFFFPSYCARSALFKVLIFVYQPSYSLSSSHDRIAMACLAHDKRFRSTFHTIINVLRGENRMPENALRTMPSQCCTCHAKNSSPVDPVAFDESDQLVQLEKLTERVNDHKQSNAELALSLTRFRKLIHENRGPVVVLPVHDDDTELMDEHISTDGEISSSSAYSRSSSASSSCSSLDLYVPPLSRLTRPRVVRLWRPSRLLNRTHTIRRSVLQGSQKIPRPPKPIKKGTFIFLPYKCKFLDKNRITDHLMQVARAMQLSRFFSRADDLSEWETKYNASIHMLTSKSSARMNQALENAKKGLDKLTIRDRDASVATSEEQAGEWVLVRPKTMAASKNVDELLNDLTDRWEKCLTVEKRQRSVSTDSDTGAKRMR